LNDGKRFLQSFAVQAQLVARFHKPVGHLNKAIDVFIKKIELDLFNFFL
jgi:hypothetical protein